MFRFPIVIKSSCRTSCTINLTTIITLLKNTPVKADISCDQVDWMNSLEEELTQVQEDLSFYNNILEKFIAEDIVSLGLDFKSDITHESSVIMITADTTVTANII